MKITTSKREFPMDKCNKGKDRCDKCKNEEKQNTIITSAVDPENSAYLQELKYLVEQEVDSEVDSISFKENDDELSVIVIWMGNLVQFDVPYEDLSFEEDGMDVDVSYISNTIIDEIERSLDER